MSRRRRVVGGVVAALLVMGAAAPWPELDDPPEIAGFKRDLVEAETAFVRIGLRSEEGRRVTCELSIDTLRGFAMDCTQRRKTVRLVWTGRSTYDTRDADPVAMGLLQDLKWWTLWREVAGGLKHTRFTPIDRPAATDFHETPMPYGAGRWMRADLPVVRLHDEVAVRMAGNTPVEIVLTDAETGRLAAALPGVPYVATLRVHFDVGVSPVAFEREI